MSHAEHGWPKTSFEEENSNRYQSGAPLVVWCGRCKTVLPADDEWARAAADGSQYAEDILLKKIHKWDGKHVIVSGIYRDIRGRIELAYRVEEPAPNTKKSGWLARLFAPKEK